MKELSIEQKAQRYDEAIEIAKEINNEQRAQPFNVMTKVFPELAESEDEKIRKSLIDMLKNDEKCYLKEIDWLEEQGQHKKFRDSIQVGDKVTRNKDGVLVNLSQLARVAKPAKNQDVQQETLCGKCRKEQPSHSCQDITALGRCAVEHEQKPAEWSKDDEDVINHLLAICDGAKRYRRQFAGCLQEDITKYQTWLKSLKERYTWKPSGEQMDAIKDAIDYLGGNTKIVRKYLMSLYEQLKKLKG